MRSPVSAVPTAGEPARGVALVIRRQGQTDLDPVGNGEGSLLLEYQRDNPSSCYYRQVGRDGSVRGVFVDGYCPFAQADGRSGYLAFAPVDDEDGVLLGRSVDFADPAHATRTTIGHSARTPEPGDTYLNACPEIGGSPRLDGTGCAYSPSAHTFYRLPSALAIDPAGRVWRLGPGHTLTVTDPVATSAAWLPKALTAGLVRHTAPLPFTPFELVGSAGSVAVTWHPSLGTIYVTENLGATWHRPTSLPDQVSDASPDATTILPDGRLLLTAQGAFWRATDTTNLRFETLDAGPIVNLYASGDRLFGVGGQGFLWMSADSGSTWRQVLGRDGSVAPGRTPVPADQLQSGQPSAAAVAARYPPTDVAVTRAGLVLALYGDLSGDSSRHSAWQLYGRDDTVVAGGLDAVRVGAAGDGFLLDTMAGTRFVGPDGSASRIDDRQSSQRLPVHAGDVFVHGAIYRPSDKLLYTGVADPDGKITAVDGRGQMWARGADHNGHTVVRWAMPGQPWHSREIGPALKGGEVTGSGSTLIITGPRQMLLSADDGATWSLLVHNAYAYSGPPFFTVRPDGSILGGDFRSGYRISYDLRTFQTPAYTDIYNQKYVGALFARGTGSTREVSRDHVHWVPFSPDAARTLLLR